MMSAASGDEICLSSCRSANESQHKQDDHRFSTQLLAAEQRAAMMLMPRSKIDLDFFLGRRRFFAAAHSLHVGHRRLSSGIVGRQ